MDDINTDSKNIFFMILFLKILSPLYERVENVKHTPKKMNSYAGAKIKLIYLVIYFLIVFPDSYTSITIWLNTLLLIFFPRISTEYI